MKVQFKIDGNIRQRLESLANNRLPAAREQFIDQVAANTLNDTAQNNPVDTGRSQAAWHAAASQLHAGGQEGNGNGHNEGHTSRSQSTDTTDIQATNAVPYVPYLEYGTSKMPPTAMLRRALIRAKRTLTNLFKLQ